MIRNDYSFILQLIQYLGCQFSLNDSSPLHLFLGIDVHSTSMELFMSQHHYIHKLLATQKVDGTKPITTQIVASPSLQRASPHQTPVDLNNYRSVVGSLQYLTWTRSNLVFVVNKLSKFM